MVFSAPVFQSYCLTLIIFVSRCITVTCLLFLWTCIRHENVMRALVIYAFFLKLLTVAL